MLQHVYSMCSANVIIAAWWQFIYIHTHRSVQTESRVGFPVYFLEMITTKTSLPIVFMCLSLRRPLYICLFAYHLRTRWAIVSKFSGHPRDSFTCQNFGKGSWVEAKKVVFIISCGTSQPHTMTGRLGSRQARRTHRHRQTMCRCNRNGRWFWWASTNIPQGYGKRGPWVGRKWHGAAYIMCDWAGRMASWKYSAILGRKKDSE